MFPLFPLRSTSRSASPSRATSGRRAAAPVLACSLALIVAVPAVADAAPDGERAASTAEASSIADVLAPAGLRTVTWSGVSVSVPADWPVVDLGARPTECVRFDRHAVYLGRQSERARCPGDALGRTGAVLVGPAPDGALTGTAHRDGELTVVPSGTGVQVTVSHGAGAREAAAARFVASGVRTRAGRAGPSRQGPGTAAAARPAPRAAVVSQRFTGDMFDTCQAPTLAQMNAWLASPFRAIGVYVGGINRACSDGPLSVGWVSAVWDKGWHLAPTYVGRQAPCTYAAGTARFTAASAAADGRAAADDAVASLGRFGMGPGRPVYLDIENYDRNDVTCRNAVLTFAESWTRRLKERGYVSGVYGNSSSLGADLRSRYTTSYVQPDMIWYANWDGRRSITGDPWLRDDVFTRGRRIHQYRGDHNETWGGVTLNIDSNYADAVLAP